GQAAPHRGQARLVAEHLPDGQVLLVRGPELGPVAGDRVVDLQQPLVDEPVGAEGRHRLADGEDVDQGVTLPGAGLGGVGVPSPEIDDDGPVDGDTDRASQLAAGREVAGERVVHEAEPRVAPALDRWRIRRWPHRERPATSTTRLTAISTRKRGRPRTPLIQNRTSAVCAAITAGARPMRIRVCRLRRQWAAFGIAVVCLGWYSANP